MGNIGRVRTIVARGEDVRTEYKKCKDTVSNSVYETVCSFLNHSGGTILLGVEDDGKIVGVNKDCADVMCKAIINASNNPELFIPSANLIPEVVEVDGKTVIVIDVRAAESVFQYKRHFYDRNGDADVDVTKQGGLLQSLFERKSPHIFESRLVDGLSIGDLDETTFSFCRKVVASNGDHPWLSMSEEEILRSCQLLEKDPLSGEDKLCYAALLLFGKEGAISRFMPRFRVEAIYHQSSYRDYQQGIGVETSYDDRLAMRCNLIQCRRKLEEFIARHLPDKYYVAPGGGERKDVRNLLFREIEANMLVHADYSSGFADFFEIYADRVITRNRTRLVSAAREGKIRLEDLENYTKNPLIVKVFRELGWVEDLGSGTRKIKHFAPLYYKASQVDVRDGENFEFCITYAPEETAETMAAPIFKSPLHGLVYALIKQIPTIKLEEMPRYVNASVRTLSRITSDLRKDGWIKRIGKNSAWEILR